MKSLNLQVTAFCEFSVKRARDDFVSRLFNPPQASLLLRDEDDRSPNLPSATSEESSYFFEKELSSPETVAATKGL